MPDLFKVCEVYPEKKDPPEKKSLPTKQFFEELERRLDILGQTPWMLQGLAIRLLGKQAQDIMEKAKESPEYSEHAKYADSIDVYNEEEDGGFHIGPDSKVEKDALAAEMGTSQADHQAMWRISETESSKESLEHIIEFFELLAERAEEGKAFTADTIDEVIEEVEVADGVMPEYKEIVEDYNKRSKDGEVTD